MTQVNPKMYGEMTEREAMKAFVNGLKKSASCAREMGELLQDNSWVETAKVLESMCENGIKLSRMKAMSKTESLQALNFKLGAFNGN